MDLRDQHVLILGAGRSGRAAADLVLRRGGRVTLLDGASEAALSETIAAFKPRGADVRAEWSGNVSPVRPDLAVISPGIHPDSDMGMLAAGLACPVWSELELGYRFCSCPLIAITGTNGKTTTVELLTRCLKHAGIAAEAAGNIGIPLCEFAGRSAGLRCLVTEVSSFQLERIDRFAPRAAAILNVTPDHYDRHGNRDAYLDAKLAILRNLPDASHAVLNAELAEDARVREHLAALRGRPRIFSAVREDLPAPAYLLRRGTEFVRRDDDGDTVICAAADLRLKGLHNAENALAALALADAAGIGAAVLAPGLHDFAPSAHRLETVAFSNGIRYINDSKATNVDAVRKAVDTVSAEIPGKILLIAGGLDKGVDFTALTPFLTSRVGEIFLIGSSREKLANLWRGVISCRMFMSLAAAFEAAAESASPGDAVLLSPGCASQDMFESYAERGQVFCDLVKRRIGE